MFGYRVVDSSLILRKVKAVICNKFSVNDCYFLVPCAGFIFCRNCCLALSCYAALLAGNLEGSWVGMEYGCFFRASDLCLSFAIMP